LNDTAPEVAALMRELHGRMSPETRLKMASAMFDDARAIVQASLPATSPRIERRLALIRRFYGNELPEAALLAFAQWQDAAR
jgi:hypothetical protein